MHWLGLGGSCRFLKLQEVGQVLSTFHHSSYCLCCDGSSLIASLVGCLSSSHLNGPKQVTKQVVEGSIDSTCYNHGRISQLDQDINGSFPKEGTPI